MANKALSRSKVPAALGTPRAPPFDLPGFFTGRFYLHVAEATLKCPKNYVKMASR